MRLKLIEALQGDFYEGLKSIGSDRVWFVYVTRLKNVRFFIIRIEDQGVFDLGMFYISEIDGRNDYSFFIYKKYRRKGLAKEFIDLIVQMDVNSRFTVSEINYKSIRLFSNKSDHLIELIDTKRKVRIYSPY
jgi:hypothetical protein